MPESQQQNVSPTVGGRRPPSWLRALGRHELPASFQSGGEDCRLEKVMKHDFFAATGLYRGAAGRVVLKIGRCAPLFGVSLAWIGRFLTGHEARLYQLVAGLPGVPRFLGTYGPNGFVHEYVEGRELRRDDRVPDDFFPRLRELLTQIHAREAAYVDLEKRENILVGDDGRPHLIDFQISWHVPANRCGSSAAARKWLELLQASDRYHLMKHWRRLRPDQMSQEAMDAARPPIWIRWHRLVFRPMTLLRRRILEWLGARSRAKDKLVTI